jgi:hypothetical protein
MGLSGSLNWAPIIKMELPSSVVEEGFVEERKRRERKKKVEIIKVKKT